MADLSNRALALLLVVAIVVSISGTIVSLNRLGQTGSPAGAVVSNDTGTTTFEISSNFSIKFDQSTLLFGSGSVIGGGPCTMNSTSNPDNDANCQGFNTSIADANLTIENDGNVRANVSLNFSLNASGLIGAGLLTTAQLLYEVTNNESSSCGQLMNGSTWENVSWGPGQEVNFSGARVCNNLDFADASDTLEVGIALEIPEDASTGARTLRIVALGCDGNSC